MDRYDDLAQRDLFAELMSLRDRQRAAQEKGNENIVIKGDRLKEQLSPWGHIKWYMTPTIEDNPARTLIVWTMRIKPGSWSGKLSCQGGHIFFVWKGNKGHTMIDEDRFDWGAECVINLPLRPPGMTYQHFNDSDEDIVLVGVCLNLTDVIGLDAGTRFDVVEPCPEWSALKQSA